MIYKYSSSHQHWHLSSMWRFRTSLFKTSMERLGCTRRCHRAAAAARSGAYLQSLRGAAAVTLAPIRLAALVFRPGIGAAAVYELDRICTDCGNIAIHSYCADGDAPRPASC